jgi:hypothetical protein
MTDTDRTPTLRYAKRRPGKRVTRAAFVCWSIAIVLLIVGVYSMFHVSSAGNWFVMDGCLTYSSAPNILRAVLDGPIVPMSASERWSRGLNQALRWPEWTSLGAGLLFVDVPLWLPIVVLGAAGVLLCRWRR